VVERSDEIRHEIEETRAEMSDTVEAIGYKANVPARAKDWVADKTDAATSKISGVAPDGQAVKNRSLRLKDATERNPLGLAVGGAAVGMIAGLLARSTRVEDEKLGPMADQVKQTVADAGQEAFDRGKEVAQAAAESTVETTKEKGREQGQELSESLKGQVGEIAPTVGVNSPRESGGEGEGSV
jgi:gas vesicle protein